MEKYKQVLVQSGDEKVCRRIRMLAHPRTRCAVMLVAGLLLLSACAAPAKPLIYIEPSAASSHYGTAIIATIEKAPTVKIPAELLERTSNRLAQQLKKRGFSVRTMPTSKGVQDYIFVKPTIERYAGGDVVGRWVGFGAGAATCTLHAELVDGQSGKKLGDVAATQTIDRGGFFTVGAEDYIVDQCADVVADGIADELLSKKPRSK